MYKTHPEPLGRELRALEEEGPTWYIFVSGKISKWFFQFTDSLVDAFESLEVPHVFTTNGKLLREATENDIILVVGLPVKEDLNDLQFALSRNKALVRFIFKPLKRGLKHPFFPLLLPP